MLMILLFVFLTGGAWQDIKMARIPNWWIAFGAVCFVTTHFIRGPSGELMGFGRETVGFLFRITVFVIVLFPLFLFRVMGAGDIKVMTLMGGYLGIFQGFTAIFYGLAASAVWSLLYMIHKNILKKRIKYFLGYLSQFLRTGQITPYYKADRDGTEAAFCFVPFLWWGFCIWIVKQGGIA